MSDTLLRKLIRELVEQELEETTSSGDAGPFSTPFAFRGNSDAGKAKAKKIASQAGYTPVDGNQEKADELGPKGQEVVSFGKKAAGAMKKPADQKVVQEDVFAEGSIDDRIKKAKETLQKVNNDWGHRKGVPTEKDKKAHADRQKKIMDRIRSLETQKRSGKKNESLSTEASDGQSPGFKRDQLEAKIKGAEMNIRALEDKIKTMKPGSSGITSAKHSIENRKKSIAKYKKDLAALSSTKTESVNENRYTDFKMSEGSPSQKIGKAIREINRQISEVDRVLRMNERLKKESGTNSGQLWKSTAAVLTKLEGRMNTISTRIRNLKS